MFDILVCDEDKEFCDTLSKMISSYFDKYNIQFNIDVFDKIDNIADFLLKKNKGLLIFVSVELNKNKGTCVGKIVRNNLCDYDTQIVYIAESEKYAMQLFETEPMDFLVKPVKPQQIESVLNRLMRRKAGIQDTICFKQNYTNIRIPYSSIMYFKSTNHKILVCSMEGENEFYGKLNDVEQQAPDYFIRVHKSYLVNVMFIASAQYDSISLKNMQKIPVSRAYKEVVEKFIRG